MTEVLDRIEEELVAAARRRAAPPAPARWRGRASRRTLALATAGVLVLAGGGAVAAVTTGGETPEVPPGIERVLEDSEGIAPLSDGLRVGLTVGEASGRWTVVAYEADRGWGVRGSEALCIATFSRAAPEAEGSSIVPCQGPWPLSEGAGLQVVPAPVLDGSKGHLTSGLVSAHVRRAELVAADGVRSPVQLSPPFTVDLAGNDLEPVPRAPRDVPPAGGSVSARLAAAATDQRPEAAILIYADGRTEHVPLGGG